MDTLKLPVIDESDEMLELVAQNDAQETGEMMKRKAELHRQELQRIRREHRQEMDELRLPHFEASDKKQHNFSAIVMGLQREKKVISFELSS